MYDPHVNGQPLTFGISGMLYQSTVLFFDRQSESLWSQLSAEAISGPHMGATLQKVPSVDTTWGDWRNRHPETLVLSRDTAHPQRYGTNPYGAYYKDLYTHGPMFPVTHHDKRLARNATVYGVEIDCHVKAYPVQVLLLSPARITDRIGDTTVTLVNEPAGTLQQVVSADGTHIPATRVFWFAWVVFHPDTTIYAPSGSPASAPTG